MWRERVGLTLPGDEGGPSPESVELAERLSAVGPSIGDIIRNGIWAELTGEEAECAYWWHGSLAEVNGVLEAPLAEPNQLVRVLEPMAVDVAEDFHGDEQLEVFVTFHADFEEEHGFQVITDGRRVLGSGYIGEATKYQRYQAK